MCSIHITATICLYKEKLDLPLVIHFAFTQAKCDISVRDKKREAKPTIRTNAGQWLDFWNNSRYRDVHYIFWNFHSKRVLLVSGWGQNPCGQWRLSSIRQLFLVIFPHLSHCIKSENQVAEINASEGRPVSLMNKVKEGNAQKTFPIEMLIYFVSPLVYILKWSSFVFSYSCLRPRSQVTENLTPREVSTIKPGEKDELLDSSCNRFLTLIFLQEFKKLCFVKQHCKSWMTGIYSFITLKVGHLQYIHQFACYSSWWQVKQQ